MVGTVKKMKKKKAGRPKKRGERKSERLVVMLEPTVKESYVVAAEREGFDGLSDWVRAVLDIAAKERGEK